MAQERKDYSQLTPQELNAEFRRLYEQLPVRLPDNFAALYAAASSEEFNRLFEMGERRARSEHLDILTEKLKDLLGFTAATNNFRQITEYVFRLAYGVGSYKEFPHRDLFYWMLGDLQTGGIFDSEQAKNIEGQAYRMYSRTPIVFGNILERLGREARLSLLGQPLEVRLGEWRQEFIEKYGDKP